MKATMKNFAVSIQPLRKAATIGVSAAALLMLANTAQATDLVLNGSFSANSVSVGGAGCTVGALNGCVQDWSSTGYTFLYASAAKAQNPGTSGVEMWGPLSSGGGSANGFAASPDGGAFLALDGDYETGSVQQTITGITAGDTYAVSFYVAYAQQEGYNGVTIQAMNVCLGTAGETYKNTGNPLSGGTNASTNINCSGSGASTALYDLSNHSFSGWEYETVDLTAGSSSDDVLSFLAYGNVQEPPFALLDGVSMDVAPAPEPATLPLLFTGLMGGLSVLRSRKWLRR
jgi:hypothetical protein